MEPNFRRCISCGKIDHKRAFWRVVRTFPSLCVQLDGGMGRSAYLCPDAACLNIARRKNRLGRCLKTTVPVEVFQALESRLVSQTSRSMS